MRTRLSFFFQETGRLQQLETRLVWRNHVMSHTSSNSQLSASHLLWSVTRSDGGYEVRPQNHLSGLSLVCFSCAGDRWVPHHYWLHWLFGWIDSSVGLGSQTGGTLVGRHPGGNWLFSLNLDECPESELTVNIISAGDNKTWCVTVQLPYERFHFVCRHWRSSFTALVQEGFRSVTTAAEPGSNLQNWGT